ncbi:MAG: ferritin-like domain-containing protein [Acidimicrobiales bacterium]
MDISQDHLRREAAAVQVAHNRAMGSMRDLVARLFGDNRYDTATKDDLVLGGFNRRRFLKFGGLSVATAAVFAACGDDDSGGDAGSATPTTAASQADITILRTASSLEELAVAVYDTAIKSGLVKTAAIGDAAKLFQEQHREHSALFKTETTQRGGTAFDRPNPAVMSMIQPTINGLKDETGVVRLAFDLELAAAQTYQSTVGKFADPKLNVAAMSVGGVEARHVEILRAVLKESAVPKAFQTTEAAVAAGTGV